MIEKLAYILPTITLVGYLANKFYFSGGQCKSKRRMDGKVIVITGSNCGIGYEAALDLAKRGGSIVLACRDLTKANEAANKIISETNNNKVQVIKLDLSSLKSIKEFADNFNAKYNRLDVLINNAGFSSKEYSTTKEGFESHIGVMHLGHFYLTQLLFEKLKNSAPSRVINVSSTGHKLGKIDFESFTKDKSVRTFKKYAQAKLANILFTRELAKRHERDGITSYSLHPGGVRTEIWRELKRPDFISLAFLLLQPLMWVIMKNCKDGAQTIIHLAVDENVIESNGEYFVDCKPTKTTKSGENMELARDRKSVV